jgi:hypothetical protein
MEAERWDVEVQPEIDQWLVENRTNLVAEITSLADRRGLEVEVLPAASQPGTKEIAMILFGSAAVIRALSPLILTVIKASFPQAVIIQQEKSKRKTLRITAE